MGIGEAFLFGSVIAGLIAVACFIGFLVAVVRQFRRRKGSARAVGTVVGLEKRVFTAGSSGVYCPVVEFTPPGGGTVRFESAFGTMPASNKAGDSVTVLYDPAAPEKAEVDSGISRWFAPACYFVFAAGSCFFSLLFLTLLFVYANP